MSVDQKRIVVTGVSRGLGLALMQGLIDRGHTVFGCARSELAVGKLRDRWPSPHAFEVLDVSQDDQVRTWAERVIADGTPPDMLVNNAATINQNAPLWNVSAEEFSCVIDINIKGVASVIRHFLPVMVKRGRGVIVNFSSGWGRTVAAEVAPYCTTKWAIEGLTRALAKDLPAGMAAVPLNPGIINTEMLQSCFGPSAGSYPDPQAWAEAAVPYILGLGPDDNGQPLSVPGF